MAKVATWRSDNRGADGWITTSVAGSWATGAAEVAQRKGLRLLVLADPMNVEDSRFERTKAGFRDLGRRLGADKRLHAMAKKAPDCPEIVYADNNEGRKFDQPNVDYRLRTELVEGFYETAPSAWKGSIHYAPYWNWASRNKGATDRAVILEAYPESIHKAEAYVPRDGQRVYLIFSGWRPHGRDLAEPSDEYLDRCVRLIRKMSARSVIWFDHQSARDSEKWVWKFRERLEGGSVGVEEPEPEQDEIEEAGVDWIAHADRRLRAVEEGLEEIRIRIASARVALENART